MVAQRQRHHVWTVEQYLSYERNMSGKHEFLDGQVYAMSGGSPNHNRISASVTRHIGEQVIGHGCQVFSSDQRVKTSNNHYTYPDLTLVCGKPEFGEEDTLLNPTFLLEVLSPSTEVYDRGEKAQRYRGLDSLQEYALIAQDRPHVEVYTRQPGSDKWLLSEADGLDAEIAFRSINAALPLRDLYEQIDFDAE